MNQFDFQSRSPCRFVSQHNDPVISFVAEVAKVAIGVFLGVVLALFTYQQFVAWHVGNVMEKARKDIMREFKR